MSFLWARLLWLLVVVPMLVAAYVFAQRRRQRYTLRFSSLSLLKDAVGKGPGFRRHIPPTLFVLALTVVIFALARPQASVMTPSDEGTVVLAIDISGSMRARDITPTRIDAAKEAARAFVQKQPPHVRIGIVAFSSTADLVQSPTTDRDQILASVDRLRTQYGTAVGSALLVSLNTIFEGQDIFGPDPNVDPQITPSLVTPDPSNTPPPPVPPGSYKSAVIVLMTDGESNQGPDPLDVASRAADLGVRVYTVGVGTPKGTVLGIEGFSFWTRLDEDTLKKISRETGGAYYRASSETSLRSIYESLSQRLIVQKDMTEITAMFAAAALVLLLAAGALSLAWFNRLP